MWGGKAVSSAASHLLQLDYFTRWEISDSAVEMPVRPATTEYRSNFMDPADSSRGKYTNWHGTAPNKSTNDAVRKPFDKQMWVSILNGYAATLILNFMLRTFYYKQHFRLKYKWLVVMILSLAYRLQLPAAMSVSLSRTDQHRETTNLEV